MGYFLGQVVQIHTVKKFLRIRAFGTLLFLQVYSPGKRSKFLKTKRSEKTMHLVFKNRNVRLLSFNECVRNHVCNKITSTIESLITIILSFHYLLTTLRDTLWNDLVFFFFLFLYLSFSLLLEVEPLWRLTQFRIHSLSREEAKYLSWADVLIQIYQPIWQLGRCKSCHTVANLKMQYTCNVRGKKTCHLVPPFFFIFHM